MEWIVLGIVALVIIGASIWRDLSRRSLRPPAGSDPDSERELRDSYRGKTLGQSHFVGLDNTGHRR